jgi:WD40 repeat protein
VLGGLDRLTVIVAATGVWDNRRWLARVRTGSDGWIQGGLIQGAGFAVDPSHVVTCAHVAVDAGARGPGEKVWVDFPMLEDAGCWATVLEDGWAPAAGTRGDTAVLRLDEAVSGVEGLRPRSVRSLRGRDFVSYGFPEGYDDGVEAGGPIGGPVGVEWAQLEVRSGLLVSPGFSGAPAWSSELSAVVGMLVTRDEASAGRVAFAVPMGVLASRSAVVAAALPTALELDPARDSHWVPRSRGTAGVVSGGRWLFQGRGRALSDLSAWLVSDEALAMRVVTGPPGCGKSAVLGRIVTCADRRYRDQVPSLDGQDPCVPPAGAIGVTVHAHDLFVTDVVAHIAGVLDLDDVQGPDQLLVAMGDLPGVRVVVDAVDEAKQPVELARFLTDLSRAGARVLVGCREHLLARLDDPDPMWLDRAPFMDRTDVHAYVAELLAGDVQGADGTRPWPVDATVAEVAAEITAAAGGNFLVAQLVAQSIRVSGLVTRPFPGRVHEAFDRLLDALPHRRRVRDLLLPLAYVLGDGLPAGELWLHACAALRRPYPLADLEDLLASPAVSFLTTATSDGHAPQYRLFHTALNEALTRDRDTDQDAQRLWAAWQPAGAGADRWANAPEYLRVHGAEHAAAAGQLPALISDPDYLTCADLVRLLPLLPVGSPAGNSPAGTVVRRAATRAAPLPAPRRARLLALTAAHLGFPDLRQSLCSVCEPPTPLWAHTLGPAHQELAGHTDTVNAVAIGQLYGREVIVSGSDDHTVRIWDGAGAPVGDPLIGHTDWVRAVAIGQLDGRDVIVTGSFDATVRIWDSAGAPVGDPLIGHNGAVNAVAIGQLDGRDVIVTGSDDNTVRIWDGTGAPAGDPLTGHTNTVTAVAIGQLDGRDVIVTGSWDTTVRIWEGAGAPVGDPLFGHTNTVTAVAIGKLDGRDVIVSGSGDQTVRIWDSAGAPVGDPLTGHNDAVNALAVGELDGRDVIVTGSDDQTVRIWDGAGAPVGDPLTGHTSAVTAVAVGKLDGRDVIVSGSDDETVRIWDGTGAPVGDPLTGHTDQVTAAKLGRLDGRDVIVTGSDDVTVRIWDGTGVPLRDPLAGHADWVSAVAIGQLDGRDVIISGSGDQTVRIWDSAGAPVGDPLRGHTDWVMAVAIGQLDGHDVIMSGSGDQTVRIWDSAGAPVGDPLRGHTDWVMAVAIGQLDGHDVIVSGSGDATVRIWDAAGAPVGYPLAGHTGPVSAVAVGQLDGRDIIASGSYDDTVQIWDSAGAPVGYPLAGHTGPVSAVAVGQLDGRDVIVSGSWDMTVRIWDGTGAPVGDPLTGHTGWVSAVAIGQLDGRDIIVSCSDDQTVRIWDVAGRLLIHLDLLAPCFSLCMTSDRIYIATGRAISAFASN